MITEPALRTTRTSLDRLLERARALDTIAAGGTGLGDLLSAACELQLDLQATPSSPVVDRARPLARQLCSELSHISPSQPTAAQRARRILGQLEATLTG